MAVAFTSSGEIVSDSKLFCSRCLSSMCQSDVEVRCGCLTKSGLTILFYVLLWEEFVDKNVDVMFISYLEEGSSSVMRILLLL